MSAKQRLFALLTVLVMALLASWFFSNFNLVSKEQRLAPSPAAQRNSLLAAQHFLQAQGYEVESIHGRTILNQLPPINDVIVIKYFFSSLTKNKEDALLDWVSTGGHLIVSPGKGFDADEEENTAPGFFERLDIYADSAELDYSALPENAGEEPFQFYSNLQSGIIDFQAEQYLSYYGDTLDFAILNSTVNNSEDFQFTEDEVFEQKDDADEGDLDSVELDSQDLPYHLVQFRYGQGLVTASSDNAFLSNNYIGEYDHAWLLSLLVRSNRDPNKIWLLYDIAMPSLWALLIKHAAAVVLSVATALLLWLWLLAQHSGPLLIPDDSERRDILEHLNMRSQHLWRYGQHQATLAVTQQQQLDSWKCHYPFLYPLSKNQQIEWISQHTAIDLMSVRFALLEPANTAESCVQQAQLLQQLQASQYGLKQ